MNLTRTVICLTLVAAGAASAAETAERFTLGGADEPTFADLESSATFSLPPPGMRNWRLSLTLAGTASNCVEIALGRDANTNTVLDAEEIVAALGWDRGVWFVSGGPGLEERFTATPSGDTLTLDVVFTASGAVKSISFQEDGRPLPFADLPALPVWLDPRRWGTACLTARGGGIRAESASVTLFPDGTLIRLK